MPQGSSVAPVWFAKVTNEVVNALDRVSAYLDHVSVFDANPSIDVASMQNFSCP